MNASAVHTGTCTHVYTQTIMHVNVLAVTQLVVDNNELEMLTDGKWGYGDCKEYCGVMSN